MDELAALVETAGGRTPASSPRCVRPGAASRIVQLAFPSAGRDRPALVRRSPTTRPPASSAPSRCGGLDVPGDACQLVVIDRILPRPDDLMSARAQAVTDAAATAS
jgi:ATP-dependent DNA helicase DinG